MGRVFWTAIGFLGGAVTTIVLWFLIQFWLFSPVRIVERLLGWNLPPNATLIWRQESRGTFLGQGSTLTIFTIPSDFAQKVLAKCPPGLKSGVFADSGIPPTDAGMKGTMAVCFMRKEDPTRTDIVVFSEDKVFHLGSDT